MAAKTEDSPLHNAAQKNSDLLGFDDVGLVFRSRMDRVGYCYSLGSSRVKPATAALVIASLASLFAGCAARASTASPTFIPISANGEPFRAAFNQQKTHVRVVELVSPTCPYCLEGVSEIQQTLFAKDSDSKLVGFVIWDPMLNGKVENVPDAMKLAHDSRVSHYWDETNDLGIAYQHLLPVATGPAWDVYMLYAPGVVWNGQQPPRPTFWMHQLAITNAPHLDPAVFAQRAISMLKKGY